MSDPVPMGEALRNACPCLASLFSRLFGAAKTDGLRGAAAGEADDDGVRPESRESRESRDRGAEAAAQSFPRSPRASEPRPSGNVLYTALWSFEARAEEELSFQEGDLFEVTSRAGDWWTARKVDRSGRVVATGIVPYNYLARGESVEAEPWYFGIMNRFEAHKCLMSVENTDGAFLVRLSEKDGVGYVLSAKISNKIKHLKIHQMQGQFFVDCSKKFTTLVDLVDHYMSNPVISMHRLEVACVKKEPKPQDLSHSTVDEYELRKEEFTLEKQLGSGFFADVYRGKWKNQINVAIKVLKTEHLNQRAFQQETQMLKKLRHRHLITLLAICSSSYPYYIVMELMEKGNLLSFLRGPEGNDLDHISLIDMAAQVADGMAYLESMNSIHRDLAARNVLVGENYICKVGDFGLARFVKDPIYICDDKQIPYKWCAPEAIRHGRFSIKSDVWAFGVLLYEILSYGGTPYPAYSNSEMYSLVMSGYRMPVPPDCPMYVYEIMLSCWEVDPDDRPNFYALKDRLQNLHICEVDLATKGMQS